MGFGKGTGDFSARQLWDWVLITLVLTITFFVLLQIIGEQVREILEVVRAFLADLISA